MRRDLVSPARGAGQCGPNPPDAVVLHVTRRHVTLLATSARAIATFGGPVLKTLHSALAAVGPSRRDLLIDRCHPALSPLDYHLSSTGDCHYDVSRWVVFQTPRLLITPAISHTMLPGQPIRDQPSRRRFR
jgi:hypothetical protein